MLTIAKIAGIAFLILGLASIAVRLLFWAMDLDSIFPELRDED